MEDDHRTVAALIEAHAGDVLVFGTVLPWQTDCGDAPTTTKPRGWDEQYRVTPLQGREWANLMTSFLEATLCVAGDLNMNLGGPQHYGTRHCRALLMDAMDSAGLACTTAYERAQPGLLSYPAIDHILLPAGVLSRTRVVAGWEGTTPEGHRLTDHSALVVEVDHNKS